MRHPLERAAAAVALASVLSGCPQDSTPPRAGGSSAGASVSVVGAGATFPYPLYSKWVSEYERVRSGVKINYQSIGSGAGIRQLTERTIDFGASDAPMTDEALTKAGAPILHVPMTLGAVVATYNLPGVEGSLKLAPDVLADVFLGAVKTWNDPRIAAENPGAKLPPTAIVPVYRSDGSGTTFVFTDYLSKVSPAWKERVGKGTAVKFPTGIGAKGNEGVTGQVKQTEGSIGYVELAYAFGNKLPAATIRNKAGKWVAPSIESVTAAAATAQLTEDLRVSITDAPGDAAYPIASFTWILVYAEAKDAEKGKAVAEFLDWALTTGQGYAPDLHYSPLPAVVVERARAKVRAISHAGKGLVGG